jgi:TolB-like protein
MFLVFMNLSLAAAAGSPSPGGLGPKLAAPELRTVGLSTETRSFLSEHLAQRLALNGLKVISANEIATLLGLERQRQVLGCQENSSCLTEMANALGVDGVVTGSVGKFEDTFQVNLKVISAVDASALAIYSAQAHGDKALLETLTVAADQLARTLLGKAPARPDVPRAAEAGPGLATAASGSLNSGTGLPTGPPVRRFVKRASAVRSAGMWTMIGGGAALVTGVVVAIANIDTIDYTSAQAQNTAAGVLAVAGLVGLGVGGVLFIVGKDEDVPLMASVTPLHSGIGVALSGRLP